MYCMSITVQVDNVCLYGLQLRYIGVESISCAYYAIQYMFSDPWLRRPVQGLDVAVAKSLMRRLILEVEELATNCMRPFFKY